MIWFGSPDHEIRRFKENFDADGKQRQLLAYSVSSKRYCMFTENLQGERADCQCIPSWPWILISAIRRQRAQPEHRWIWDAWEYIFALAIDGPNAARAKRKPYFNLPAMMGRWYLAFMS